MSGDRRFEVTIEYYGEVWATDEDQIDEAILQALKLLSDTLDIGNVQIDEVID